MRKDGERIMIGDDIVIQIVWCKNGLCKVGVEAPRVVPVHRGEIYERIQRGLGPPKRDEC
jgi:carbon storage regulator